VLVTHLINTATYEMERKSLKIRKEFTKGS
jgi:hypothetical protein